MTDEQAIIEPAQPELVLYESGAEILALPPGWQEATRIDPDDDPLHHTRQRVHLHTPRSFVEYVNRFGTEETVVYVDIDKDRVTAILDHTINGGPGWKEHRAEYAPILTTDAERLFDNVNRYLSRGAMVNLLDSVKGRVVEPDTAALLELAQQFNVNRTLEFTEGHRLRDGQRTIKFMETQTATGGSGDIAIPDEVVFELPIHEGGVDWRIETEFRYLLDEDGDLSVALVFHRKSDLLRDATRRIVSDIEVGLDSALVLYGELVQ